MLPFEDSFSEAFSADSVVVPEVSSAAVMVNEEALEKTLCLSQKCSAEAIGELAYNAMWYTVEPLYNGHFGTCYFCSIREVSTIWR